MSVEKKWAFYLRNKKQRSLIQTSRGTEEEARTVLEALRARYPGQRVEMMMQSTGTVAQMRAANYKALYGVTTTDEISFSPAFMARWENAQWRRCAKK